MSNYIKITSDNFTRVKSDSNGNPRYAIHYTCFDCPESEKSDISSNYAYTVKLAKSVLPGSRKFHNKQYGGGIVVQSYNIRDEVDRVNRHNMKVFVQSLIGDNEVLDTVLCHGNSFYFLCTDKYDNFDRVNTRVYLTPNDSEKTIRQALANKGLISFNEVF